MQIGLEIVPTRLFRIGTMQNYLVPVNGACNLPYISGAWGNTSLLSHIFFLFSLVLFVYIHTIYVLCIDLSLGAELFFNQLNYLVFASTSAPGYSSFLQRIISVCAPSFSPRYPPSPLSPLSVSLPLYQTYS